MSKHEILLAGQLTNFISVTNKLYVVYCLSLGNCVNRQAHLCFVFLWEIASIGKPMYVLYSPWEIASIGKPICVFVWFVCGKLRHRQIQI